MGQASILVIPRRALVEVIKRQPKLRELLDATIAVRTAETESRISEYQRVFVGT
jgi:hypothetical protein